MCQRNILVRFFLPVLKVLLATPVFLENKDGKAKIVSLDVNKRHGATARFTLQNWLKGRADLYEFNAGTHRYQPDRLDADNMVFIRDAAVEE